MSQSSDGKNGSNLFAGESFRNFRLGEDIGRSPCPRSLGGPSIVQPSGRPQQGILPTKHCEPEITNGDERRRKRRRRSATCIAKRETCYLTLVFARSFRWQIFCLCLPGSLRATPTTHSMLEIGSRPPRQRLDQTMQSSAPQQY